MPHPLPLREQAVVFRELATLIGAGIGLSSALNTLQNRPLSYPFRRLLQIAERRVGKGERLTTVMRSQPGLFSDLTIALLEAGEQSGRLEQMLADVASYLERELELRNMISRETFYAKILILAALFIPLGARTMIAWLTSDAARAVTIFLQTTLLYAVIAGVPALAFCLVYRRLAGSASGRSAVDATKLHLPLVGPVVERLALAKFARAFAALFEAGVSYPTALALAANTCGNRFLAGQFLTAIPRIEKGGALSQALRHTRLANSLLLRLLQTGEDTGNIDAMMTKAAQHYEDEAQTQIRRLAVAIVPVVVVVMGLVIGLMVARFYLNFYSQLDQF